MTVKELIVELLQHNLDLEVRYSGEYESGPIIEVRQENSGLIFTHVELRGEY